MSIWMSRQIVLAAAVVAMLSVGELASAQESKKLRWEPVILKFELGDRLKKPPKNAVLFVGSSSIRLWNTDDALPQMQTINRGFGGSQTSDLLQYYERIVPKYQPAVIVFYCGDNDIKAGKTPERVIDDFQEFQQRVARDLPNTVLVYLPIKPSKSRWSLWSQMQQVNAAIFDMAQTTDSLVYCDTATVLLGDDGEPDSKYFALDRLHLNNAGYALWNAELQKTVDGLLTGLNKTP